MGIDIHGWIETRDADTDAFFNEEVWFAVVDIGQLVERSVDMFSMLFGVRQGRGFIPVAAYRGLPSDVSDTARDANSDADGKYHSESWISYSEIQSLDWSQVNDTGTKSREQVLTDSMRTVFKIMKVLADSFGEGNVRMVVWFDS